MEIVSSEIGLAASRPDHADAPTIRARCMAGPCFRGKGVPLPYKPDSVHLLRGWTAISLTPPRRGGLLAQDATNTRRLTGGPPFPCSVLHHARFAVPSGYPDSRWALTPPFHPCLCPRGPSAVSFCCTVCPGSSRCPSLTFMRRVALWCPDFPHLRLRETATVRGAARARWGRGACFPIKNASTGYSAEYGMFGRNGFILAN